MIFKHSWNFYYDLKNNFITFFHKLGFHNKLEDNPIGGINWKRCPYCGAQWNSNNYCVRKAS